MTPPELTIPKSGNCKSFNGSAEDLNVKECSQFKRASFKNGKLLQVDEDAFRFIRHTFEEAYGFFLSRDVFRSGSSLATQGLPPKGSNEPVFINTNWEEYQEVVSWLIKARILAVVIAPEWRDHLWFAPLLAASTHLLELRREWLRPRKGIQVPDCKILCLFADFRYAERASERPIRIPTPTTEQCRSIPTTPRPTAPQHPATFLSKKPAQHIKKEFFLKYGKDILPPKLLADIIRGLTHGFPTRYRGGGDFIRRYTVPPKTEEDKEKAREKAREMVEKGWGAGPFDTPPTPNPKCPKNPILTLAFTIPKHKWIDDGSLRLFFHKSHPRGLSVNSLTPRHDIKTYFPEGQFQYLTFAILVSMIAKAGPKTRLTQFDAKDAYKQLYIQDSDGNQQVFEVDGKFYADWCACFGSLYGNDIYSAFGHAHCMCLASMAGTASKSLCR